MAFNPDMSGARLGADTRARLTASRSDIFPRLIAMQKLIDARGFALFRLVGSGLPRKRSLQCDYESWAPGFGPGASDAFVQGYGDHLLGHIEELLLPLVWNSRDHDVVCDVGDFARFVTRLPVGTLSYAGIAFPVRLGAVGNGFVMFGMSASVDLTSAAILDLHGRACKVMIDVLAMAERRMAPSEALSDREIACLQLAGDGRISDEIAENLGLSVHTVNAYLGSATIKLDSVNRVQAIAKAIRLGYIN